VQKDDGIFLWHRNNGGVPTRPRRAHYRSNVPA
jgi:hypothetical protein